MASVYVQNNKRGRDEFCWNGGLVLPEAKRSNVGYDTDLMALLDRIENIDNIEKSNSDCGVVINELEIQEEERLNVVIKSLEDEIGLKPNAAENGDGAVKETVVDEKNNNDSSCGSLVDGVSEATTSVSDVGELASEESLYYDDDLRAEFGFFLDHGAAADELGIMLNQCGSGDHSMGSYYQDSFHGYVDNTEVFYGSLWEDDIWQVNDHAAAAFVQNGPTIQEVVFAGAESQDVGNDTRQIQCLSTAAEEGA